MRRFAIVAALSLFLGASVAAQEDRTFPQIPENDIESPSEPNPVKDKACRCCEECMAAMKSTKGKEEGTPKTGGCRDCCERCGKVKHPTEKQVPPEIVK